MNDFQINTPIRHGLLSGLEVQIKDKWDWFVFWDIFVNRDYPLMINPGKREAPVKVLDLGANHGYFTLFAADLFIRNKVAYEIIAVEPMSKTYNELVTRVGPVPHVKCVHGAVGKKAGEKGYITLSLNHATSGIVGPNSKYPKEKIIYIDPEKLYDGPIDIIKCDIEGSEFALLKNYPDLFKRTKLVFMEVHYPERSKDVADWMPRDGNTKEFFDKMAELGFSRHQTVDHGTSSVEVFFRA